MDTEIQTYAMIVLHQAKAGSHIWHTTLKANIFPSGPLGQSIINAFFILVTHL